MIKKLLLITISCPLFLNSQSQFGTVAGCEAQYNQNITEVLNKLAPTVTPNILSMAQAYIQLVKEKEKFDEQMLYMERTTIKDALIQGLLKRPYDNFANCRELNLITAQESYMKGCDIQYAEDVKKVLHIVQCQLNQKRSLSNYVIKQTLDDCPKYILTYRNRAIVIAKLLILERETILDFKPLEGLLRKPYDVYDQCRDPASIIQFSYKT